MCNVFISYLMNFLATQLHRTQLKKRVGCNRTFLCHSDEDGSLFESGSSKCFFLTLFQGVFPKAYIHLKILTIIIIISFYL